MSPRVERIGDCELWLGDAFEILPMLGLVDLVVADPPYMINTTSAGAGKLNPWADLTNGAFWFAELYRLCRRKLHPSGALWTFLNWRTIPTAQKAAFDADWQIESLLVWDKEWIGPGGLRGLRPSYELVALMAQPGFAISDRGIPDIKRCKWAGQKPTGHPAEKPAELVEWLISISGGEIVLDPFLGSGTSGVACSRLGKRFIGIELDPRHFEAACERIQATLDQPRLFTEPAPRPEQEALFA